MKRLAILALAVACGSAHAISFTNVSLTQGSNLQGTHSNPVASGNSFTFSLTGAGPHGGALLDSGETANLNWDYKMAATPGYAITGITLQYSFRISSADPDADLEAITSNFQIYAGSHSLGSPVLQPPPPGDDEDFGASSQIETLTLRATGLNLSSAYVTATTTFLNFGDDSVEIVGGGSTVTQQAVPEPASLAALAIGGLGLLRRRRKA